jgi:predicted metal-dependent hydrolase
MATCGGSNNDSIDAVFERGLALFNCGDYFTCHEVWEEIWLRGAGDDKLFYQGLIQAAVAILHAERGNLRGAVSTWRKSRAKLAAPPANHMGIALGEFREALDEFITNAKDPEDLPPRPRIRRSS